MRLIIFFLLIFGIILAGCSNNYDSINNYDELNQTEKEKIAHDIYNNVDEQYIDKEKDNVDLGELI